MTGASVLLTIGVGIFAFVVFRALNWGRRNPSLSEQLRPEALIVQAKKERVQGSVSLHQPERGTLGIPKARGTVSIRR